MEANSDNSFNERSGSVPYSYRSYDDFFRKERAALACFMLKFRATWEEADDAAQEAMVAALVHWGELTNPRAWVRVVAERKFLQQRARLDYGEELSGRPGWGVECYNPLPSENEEYQEVISMIGRLPLAQRRVLAWTFDGYGPAEIAAILDEDAATVRSNLRHARQQMIAWLDERKYAQLSAGTVK